MSFIDRIVTAVTPPESDEERARAHQEARDMAQPGDWLSTVLDQHERIEQSFTKVREAKDAAGREAARKELAAVLNGHSLAEELVLYPAMTELDTKAHAALAYEEQQATKIQMALLEQLDPMSQDYEEKLGHIEGAVKHHIYSEEGTWFPEVMRNGRGADSEMLKKRFNEEYGKYTGETGDKPAIGGGQGFSVDQEETGATQSGGGRPGAMMGAEMGAAGAGSM